MCLSLRRRGLHHLHPHSRGLLHHPQPIPSRTRAVGLWTLSLHLRRLRARTQPLLRACLRRLSALHGWQHGRTIEESLVKLTLSNAVDATEGVPAIPRVASGRPDSAHTGAAQDPGRADVMLNANVRCCVYCAAPASSHRTLSHADGDDQQQYSQSGIEAHSDDHVTFAYIVRQAGSAAAGESSSNYRKQPCSWRP